MKSGRLLIALAAGLSGIYPVLHAQTDSANPPPPPAEHHERGGRFSPEQIVARIDQAVGGLSADQKSKITDIINKTREQIQALAPEERREKWRELMQAQNQQIRALLTPDQQTKFDQMPRMARGGGHHADN